jgi:hypothetical protein
MVTEMTMTTSPLEVAGSYRAPELAVGECTTLDTRQ